MPSCPVHGCGRPCRSRELVCRRCWRLIPGSLRRAVVTNRDQLSLEAAAAHVTAACAAIDAAETALTTRTNGTP